MNTGLLVITHNSIGADIVSTATDIFGNLPLQVIVMEIRPNSIYDDKLSEAQKHIAELSKQGDVLVLSDIFGATPCNIAVKAAEGTGAKVIAGINLPMLVRILNYAQLPLNEIVAKALAAGKDSIIECV